MALDCIAFYESRAGTTALSEIAGLADNHVRVSGDNISVPALCNKVFATVNCADIGGAQTLAQLQLSSPSLRGRTLLDLSCHQGSGTSNLLIGNNPPMDIFPNPVALAPGEDLKCLAAQSSTATGNITEVVFLTDGVIAAPAPGAEVEHVYCTSSTTVTAHAWSTCTLTFSQALRTGTYALVGAKVASATSIAARFRIPGQANLPGVPCCLNLYNTVDPAGGLFRNGKLGVWGVFTDNNPPQMDILCSSADTAQYVILDLIKIG